MGGKGWWSRGEALRSSELNPTFSPSLRPSWFRSGTPSPWPQTPESRRRSWLSTSWTPLGAWRGWSTSCTTSATEASPLRRYCRPAWPRPSCKPEKVVNRDAGCSVFWLVTLRLVFSDGRNRGLCPFGQLQGDGHGRRDRSH